MFSSRARLMLLAIASSYPRDAVNMTHGGLAWRRLPIVAVAIAGLTSSCAPATTTGKADLDLSLTVSRSEGCR